jgi:glycosyltransferase involved in cell wall biosynthesis
MVASENGPLLSAPGDEAGLSHALHTLAADPALRKRVGEANRAKAIAEYDEKRMIERYRTLYGGLIGRR